MPAKAVAARLRRAEPSCQIQEGMRRYSRQLVAQCMRFGTAPSLSNASGAAVAAQSAALPAGTGASKVLPGNRAVEDLQRSCY